MGDDNTLNSIIECSKKDDSLNDSPKWQGRRKDFINLFKDCNFGEAKNLISQLNVPKPLVCQAAYDVFIGWVNKGHEEKYRRAIDAFPDYDFECWIKPS